MKYYSVKIDTTFTKTFFVEANSEEEAMKLYENDIDNCTETSDDDTDRHDYKFYSIESNAFDLHEEIYDSLENGHFENSN